MNGSSGKKNQDYSGFEGCHPDTTE